MRNGSQLASKVVVLVNPNARAMRADPRLAARLAVMSEGIAEVIVTEQPDLPRLAQTIVERQVQTLALCGGDGTGQAVLTALMRARRPARLPRIALLRGGTVNTIASNLGVRGSPESLLAALCMRLRAGSPLPTMRQEVISVEGRVGFVFAAALGARFLELYYDHPRPSLSRAIVLAAEVAWSALVSGRVAERLFQPTDVRAILDDNREIVVPAARLIVASTLTDVGVGMRICPRARDLPGHFQLLVSALSPNAMARQLPAVRAGRALVGDNHLDAIVARAELTFPDEEPYTLDGELFRGASLDVRSAGALEIVRA